MKTELKFEDGKLIAKAVVGLDKDQDGEMSVGADIVLFIDAKEAVAEIIKQEIPQWLKDLLSKVLPAGETPEPTPAPVQE